MFLIPNEDIVDCIGQPFIRPGSHFVAARREYRVYQLYLRLFPILLPLAQRDIKWDRRWYPHRGRSGVGWSGHGLVGLLQPRCRKRGPAVHREGSTTHCSGAGGVRVSPWCDTAKRWWAPQEVHFYSVEAFTNIAGYWRGRVALRTWSVEYSSVN